MLTRKVQEQSLIVRIPLDLARDFFSESGDLPSDRFPATMILAEAVGKSLPAKREDKRKRAKPVVLKKTKKSMMTSRSPFELPLLTR